MDSFDELYQNYSQDIFRFLYKLCGYDRVLAEDLMQETFLHGFPSPRVPQRCFFTEQNCCYKKN